MESDNDDIFDKIAQLGELLTQLDIECTALTCGNPVETSLEFVRLQVPLRASQNTCVTLEIQKTYDSTENVIFPVEPQYLQELQVLHTDSRVTVINGVRALKLLSLVMPSRTKQDANRKVDYWVGPSNLIIGIHINVLYNAYIGSKLEKRLKTPEELLDNPPPFSQGMTRSKRFWDCVGRTHLGLFLLSKSYNDFSRRIIFNIQYVLTYSMLAEGKNESQAVLAFKSAIECVIKPEIKGSFKTYIDDLPTTLKAELYRFRRELYKDDYDPLRNAQIAITRFTHQPSVLDFEQISYLEVFQDRLKNYLLKLSREQLKSLALDIPTHRSSGSLFHSRKVGGGVADLQMIIGLYRLSKGEHSYLRNIYQREINNILEIDLVELGHLHRDFMEEARAACTWFLSLPQYHDIPALMYSIYPEREPKSRTFALFDFACQFATQGPVALLQNFFKCQREAREAFKGLNNKTVKNFFRRDFDYVLSLDSKVATDNLSHEICRHVYTPLLEVFDDPLAKLGIERFFTPYLIAPCKKKPKDTVEYYGKKLIHNIPVLIEHEQKGTRSSPKKEALEFFTEIPNVPLRTSFEEIKNALRTYGRVILKSYTGSGKTVLAAAMCKSIIQFPSLQAILIFRKTCQFFGIPHEIYFSGEKPNFDKLKDKTVLCTPHFVLSLAARLKTHLVVLDEAENLREDFAFNLYKSRYISNRVLIMSATPDSILGEDETFRIIKEGSNNFPVEEETVEESKLQTFFSKLTSEKVLVCCHSEPACYKLATMLRKIGRQALVLDSITRKETNVDMSAQFLLSTNVVRSSVTIPDLDVVVDYGRKYLSFQDSLNHHETLVLFNVTNDERTQLKGRVGRTHPGKYIRVTKHFLTANNPPDYLSGFLRNISVEISNFDITNFPHKIVRNSLYQSILRLTSISVKFGITMSNSYPLEIKILRTISKSSKIRPIILLVGLEILNLFARIKYLGDDDEIKNLVQNIHQRFKSLKITDMDQLFKDLTKVPGIGTEVGLITQWAEDSVNMSNDDINMATSRLLGDLMPHNIYDVKNGYGLQAIYQKDKVAVDLSDGTYILFGVTHFNGDFTFACSLKICKYEYSTLECVQVGLLNTVVVEGSTHVTPNVRAQRKNMPIYAGLNEHREMELFSPSDLPKILNDLSRYVKSFIPRELGESEMKLCTSGCPMSSLPSFTVMTAIAYTAGLNMKLRYPESDFLVYGDDAIVGGSLEAVQFFTKCREQMGLLTKMESTGLAQDTDETLNVFTERFTDNITKELVPALKMRGAINAYKAHHPSQTLLAKQMYQTDMANNLMAIHRISPSLCDFITSDSEGNIGFARRILPSRLLARKLIRSSPLASVHYAHCDMVEVEGCVTAVEHLLLFIVPSTRAPPERYEELIKEDIAEPFHCTKEIRDYIRRAINESRDHSLLKWLELDVDSIEWAERLNKYFPAGECLSTSGEIQ